MQLYPLALTDESPVQCDFYVPNLVLVQKCSVMFCFAWAIEDIEINRGANNSLLRIVTTAT